MNSWFRSWHGAPTDPKWLAIAQRTQTNAGMVSAVFWALMDHASQSNDRGDVSTFDVESYAAFSGWEPRQIASIVDALRDKKLINNNKLSAWEIRQPKREDGSAERSREWRERKRTQANANDRREDKRRIDAASHDAPSEEAELYQRGKQILGQTSGGLIAKLLKAKNGSIPKARAAIEQASEKQNPREYIGRIAAGVSVDPGHIREIV